MLPSESLELFEPVEALSFVYEELNPYFLAKLTNKDQKIKITSYGLGLHGSIEVSMNKLKMFFGTRCGSGEAVPLMFTSDTILIRVGLLMNNW